MADIVKRLRAITGQAGDHGDVQLCDAAADEIDRLRLANDAKTQRDRRLSEITADMPRWRNLTLLQQLRDGGAAMKCVPMFCVDAMRHAADEIERLRLTDREQHCLRKAVEMLADDADREDGIARSQIAAVLSDVANRIG